jgi:hypothetical protein
MAQNHILLETINLTQSAASVTFDNLPSTGYTDLKIVISSRGNNASTVTFCLLEFNGVSTNLSSRQLSGEGTGAVASYAYASNILFNTTGSTATGSTFGNSEIYIPNYTSTTTHKSVSIDTVTENNGSYGAQQAVAGIWANNSAITSITIFAANGSLSKVQTFNANSTFSLYGVAALGTTPVTAPFASGGNIVANDGTYWYHAFLSSGTFTPFKALSCDALVIAGGGSGGANGGGGGGAGGFRSGTSLSLTEQGYAVTVGAGGSGSAVASPPTSGNDSVFSTITSTGGGRGGSNAGYVALTGGSGGGGGMFEAAWDDGASGNTPSTSPSQGFAGGNGGGIGQGENASGGGGGGATAVGTNASNGTPGNGGAGSSAFSTWASATTTGVSGSYAGGGGGGAWNSSGARSTGGSGGGGAGGTGGGGATYSSVAGTASTGSGGGGGGTGATIASGNGGSGIVIVRYPMV